MKKGKIITVFNLLCLSVFILLCLFLFTPNTRVEGMVSSTSSIATNLIIIGIILAVITLILFNANKIGLYFFPNMVSPPLGTYSVRS